MIRINLATRKQAVALPDTGTGSISLFKFKSDPRLDGIKELPLRKIALMVVVALVAGYVLDGSKDDAIKQIDAAIARGQAAQSKLQREVAKTRGYDEQKKQMDADELTLKAKIDTMKKLVTDKFAINQIFLQISSSVPKGIWLSDVRFEKEGKATFKGYATDFMQISNFIKGLSESAYLQDPSLSNSEQSQDEEGMPVLKFELSAKRR